MGLLARIGGVLTSIPPPAPRQNWLDNSNFTVNQRAYASGTTLTPGASADVFAHDRWKYVAGAAAGSYTYAALANGSVSVTATAGVLTQIVPGYRVNSAVAIISWLGAATSISVGGTSYTGIAITIGGDTRKYAYVTGLTVGNNLAVALTTGGVYSDLMLEGVTATGYPVGPYQRVRPSVELQECERYYQSSYPLGSAPAAKVASPYIFYSAMPGLTASLQSGHINFPFQPAMRAAPTLTLYSPVTGASGKVADVTNGADVTPTVVSAAATQGAAIRAAIGTASTTCSLSAHFTASADL